MAKAENVISAEMIELPLWPRAVQITWRLLISLVFLLSGLAEDLLRLIQRADSPHPPRQFTVVAAYLIIVYLAYAAAILPVDAALHRRHARWLRRWLDRRLRQGAGFFVGSSLVVIGRVLMPGNGWMLVAGAWLLLFFASVLVEGRLAPTARHEPIALTIWSWLWMSIGLWGLWIWLNRRGISPELSCIWLALQLGVWRLILHRWRTHGWMWVPSVIE